MHFDDLFSKFACLKYITKYELYENYILKYIINNIILAISPEVFEHIFNLASQQVKQQMQEIIGNHSKANKVYSYAQRPNNNLHLQSMSIKSSNQYPYFSDRYPHNNSNINIKPEYFGSLVSQNDFHSQYALRISPTYIFLYNGHFIVSTDKNISDLKVAVIKKLENGSVIAEKVGQHELKLNNIPIHREIIQDGDKLSFGKDNEFSLIYYKNINSTPNENKIHNIKENSINEEIQLYIEVLKDYFIQPSDITDPIETFPYPFSEDFINQLISCGYIYLVEPNSIQFTTGLKTISRKILLQGPDGSELMQDFLIRYLAKYLNAKLLIIDDLFIETLLLRLEVKGDNRIKKIKPNDKVRYIGNQNKAKLFEKGKVVRITGKKIAVTFRDPIKDTPYVVMCDISELCHRSISKKYERTSILIDALEYLLNNDDDRIVIYFRGNNQIIRNGAFEDLKRMMNRCSKKIIFVCQSIFLKKKNACTQIEELSNVLKNDDQLNSMSTPKYEEDPFEGSDDESDHINENSRSPRISHLFTNKIKIIPGDNLTLWNKKLEEDKREYTHTQNINYIQRLLQKNKIISKFDRNPLLSKRLLTPKEFEQIIAYSIYHSYKYHPDDTYLDSEQRLHISPDSINAAIETKDFVFRKTKSHSLIYEIELENEYERKLITEVIPPSEIGVSFDDIGALDHIKNTLIETVLLPLQRPELFKRGNLVKPCKGILLFGPPGTGKTMLAKAIATESGANFINISMSSVASKWFGDGEKFSRAIFTLASKLSPSIIFIDEVDSFLGKRDKTNEHEAMRKIKNEFMTYWDGLKSKETERILVLAATNRPFDLDDAVLRRLPRRLLIDLPDFENRIKILKVILSNEELADDVDMNEISRMTEGYSGSDIKNLCIEAAHEPLREYIKMEKGNPQLLNKSEDGKDNEPLLRPILMSDFIKAREKICSSVLEDSQTIAELRQWNEMYGEGGNRKKTIPTYFM